MENLKMTLTFIVLFWIVFWTIYIPIRLLLPNTFEYQHPTNKNQLCTQKFDFLMQNERFEGCIKIESIK